MWLSSTPRGPADDFWYMPTGMPTAAGVRVSPDQAMRLTIVYACVKVLAETVAQLPLILYRRLDRGKERAVDHPLYGIMSRRPNIAQTSFEWRETKQGHLSLRGNAYSEILYKGSRIVGLGTPFHPDLVRVEEIPGGWRYFVKDKQNGHERMILREEMLHLRGLASSGIMGLSPIEMEREAIGFAIAAQEHGARFYQNGAVFPGWIEHPANFKDPEQRRKFRDNWQESQTGGNRFKTPVLEYGMKYHEIPIKHTDAQYLETRKFENEDVARIFRMPPHKVGILERSTNNNIEHQGIEFVTDTMMPWLVRWEQRLSESLLTEDEQEEYFFEFLVDGLLRGDAAARSDYYSKGIQDGWLVRNEVREMENRNPLPGLDEPLEPLNMVRSTERDPRKKQDREQALQMAAAERVIRKEQQAVRKMVERHADVGALHDEVVAFYADHVAYVRESLVIDEAAARAWCVRQCEMLPSDAPEQWAGVVESWNARDLITLIQEKTDEARPPAG